jgi:hypothetical protein
LTDSPLFARQMANSGPSVSLLVFVVCADSYSVWHEPARKVALVRLCKVSVVSL